MTFGMTCIWHAPAVISHGLNEVFASIPHPSQRSLPSSALAL